MSCLWHHVLMFLAVSCTNGLCLWLQRYRRQVRRNGGSISSPWQPVSWTEFCPTTHRFSLYQTPPLYLQLINLPPSLLSPSSPHFLIFQHERPACLSPPHLTTLYIYSSTAFKITHTLFLTSITSMLYIVMISSNNNRSKNNCTYAYMVASNTATQTENNKLYLDQKSINKY